MTGGVGGRGGELFCSKSCGEVASLRLEWGLFQTVEFISSKIFWARTPGLFFLNNLTIASQTVSIYVVPAHPRLYIASLSNFIISKSYHIFSNKNHLKKTASQNIRSFLLYFLFTCSDKLLEKWYGFLWFLVLRRISVCEISRPHANK